MQKKQIKVSEIIAMLDNGQSRKEITAELQLNSKDATLIFNHEKIKGRKKKMATTAELIDDTIDENVDNTVSQQVLQDNVDADLTAINSDSDISEGRIIVEVAESEVVNEVAEDLN